MAVKTNVKINGKDYYKTTLKIGIKNDGKPIIKTFYGSSKSEAEAKKKAYSDDLKNKINTTLAKSQLNIAVKDYLENIAKNEIKISSFNRYEGVYNLYVKDCPFKLTKVEDVNRVEIEKYYNDLRSKGKSESQIYNINKLLKKFFNYCIDERAIYFNPCRRIRIDQQAGKKPIVVLTRDQIDKLKIAIKDHRYECLILLALGTGAREGELLSLKWEDIDTENCQIKINKTLSEVKIDGKYQIIITSPKTKKSNGTVPYPAELNEYIVKHKMNQLIEKSNNLINYADIGDYVFKTENGTFIRQQSFLKTYKKLLMKAGIEPQKFHSIRHTYATILFEEKADLKTVSDLLRNDSKITNEIYTHVSEDLRRREANKMSTIFTKTN